MIETSADGRIVLLQGRGSTYAVGVTRDGRWVTLFWGSRIDVDDVPLPESAAHRALMGQDDEEFPGWSGLQHHEPALEVTNLARKTQVL